MKQDSKNFWNSISGIYPVMRRNPLSKRILEKENHAIQDLLDSGIQINFSMILDIACGRGNSLKLLDHHQSYKFAVDLSYKMVHKTHSYFSGVHFINADAQRLPFAAKSFSLIFCIGLIDYFEDPSRLLLEIHRVLIPSHFALLSISKPHLVNHLRSVCSLPVYQRTHKEFSPVLERFSFKICKTAETTLQILCLIQKN